MFALRKFITQGHTALFRNIASSTKIIDLSYDDTTGISTISMARPPVNSLNTELLRTLRDALIETEKGGSKGIILTSSLPTVFSAGLDIMEMYKPDLQKAKQFWLTLQDTWATLYSIGIPVAAAINGACPAGGCLLAMSCEYRVFVDGRHAMGLNETQLGIIAPKWFQNVYINTIGYRQAELALLRGAQFQPKEALRIGLVDEIATDKADAIAKCNSYILSFAKIPGSARSITKKQLRAPVLQWLKENKETDVNQFVEYVQQPKVQTGLKLYIEHLKQKQQ